ncbi:ADP-ribosyltransferase [Actinomyces glycerinitolerans]|uniref:Adp ribosyltransferase n=1 Tax=Actinomyces glycerinitolerans TaxID=1892869 RepID=A0A1M4RZB8_9ACTO|nr:ADP-ribosyltransferase [Actinomyces glycerinitolerans]SHE25335.1 adp ribosyltransferase [Actinomyces glycerinitolerans]
MTVANPLVAAQQESESSFWAGTGVGEDISDLSQAIGEGSWVQGSLAGVGLAGDVLFTVTNPIAAGVSIVVGWIIEHIYPLDEMLEQLTGDADAVIAGSQTWTNISNAYTQQATSLNDYLTADMADQAGQTADAWRTRAGKLAGGMNAMSAAAANIAKGLEISAAIVQFVHDMVRDAISEAIGMFFEAAAEEIFSLGLGTPAVVAQIGTWVADKVSMLASKAKDLVNSFEALSELLKKIEPGVTKLMNGLKKLDLSDWAESKGTQVGRDIKNHMSGSTPKHHATTLTAAHTTSSTSGGGATNASTTTNSSSHSTTSSAGGGHSTTNTSSSGGAGSPGSGSGGSGTSYHGIDPIHGDTTGTTSSSSAHSSTSSSAGATHTSSSSPAASTSSTPASASMADAAGGSHTRAGTTTPQADTPATTPAVPTTDASYHGIDPIHGDTTSTPSAHNTTHADTTRADAGSGADSPRAGSSGPEGTHASGPEADTGRTEAGAPDAGSSRTNDTDTGRADSGSAPAEADGTHTGDGADADSSRPAQHDTESADRDAQTTPARTDADQPDPTARDGSSPETGQDTGRSERPGQPTGEGAGPHSSRTGSPDADTPDANNPHSERAPETDQPDTQHANDTGDGKTGTDSEPGNTNPNNTSTDTHGRSDTDTDTHGRSDADADPGSNRPADHDPQQHQPDEHGKQTPDEHPKDPESPEPEHPKGQEPDPERPKGQEPESVSARRDPEDNNSHSNAAAAEATTPHTKTDDTPDPTGNHKDTPDTDTTSNHSNNDGDASSHDAHDSEPPSDSDGHVHFNENDVPTPPQETFDTSRYAYNDPEVARWADETSAATGLSRDGVIGTYDYTTNNGYSTMNPALRGSPDAPLTPEVQARIDNTLKGMDELPPVPGTTYRGTNLPDDVYHSLKDGAKEYVDQGFLSSSKEGNIADTFKGNSNNAVVFTIEGHSGVDVNPFSAHKGEAEILFRPGTTFKVTKAELGADGILRVEMTEV